MPEGDRSSPRAKSFIQEIGEGTVNSTDAIGQSTANMTDEEFTILKLLVEKRDREAAQVTVKPAITAQHCIPRSLIPEILPDVCVSLESNEGKMDPELTELEPPSAGTGLETPDSNVPQSRGYGRQDKPSPTAICPLAWDRTRGRHLFTNGTRWYASRDSYDTGKTQGQDN